MVRKIFDKLTRDNYAENGDKSWVMVYPKGIKLRDWVKIFAEIVSVGLWKQVRA